MKKGAPKDSPRPKDEAYADWVLPPRLNAEDDPVLAELWDNELDAIYDTLPDGPTAQERTG